MADHILKSIRKTYVLVSARFPLAFSTKPVPLKIGIYKDLYKEGIDKGKLKEFLSFYTQTPDYLRTIKAGSPRIAIDGTEAGIVTDQQEHIAASALLATMGL